MENCDLKNEPLVACNKRAVFENATSEAIVQLQQNLLAPVVIAFSDFDESEYADTHLFDKNKGYDAPHPDIVKYYCDQLKAFDSKYTQKEIARNILVLTTAD